MSSEVQEKRENPLLSLGLNIVIPVIILMRFSGDDRLGPVFGLLVALAFPVTYGLYDFARRRSFNFISGLGFISILLTGGIGLLKLDVQWLAIKEAGIPLILAVAVVVSMRTRFPLVRTLFSKIIDVDRVEAALVERDGMARYERRVVRASYVVAASFLLSAVLNYVLARLIVVSPAGTEAFNSELGKMTALSFPVITVPSVTVLGIAIYYLVSGIVQQTGLDMKDIFRQA